MTKNFIVARPRVFYSTHYDSLTKGAYYLDIEFKLLLQNGRLTGNKSVRFFFYQILSL